MFKASRGAILINQLVEKQMFEQDGHQKKLFREIKDRMAAIRQRYEKQQFDSKSYYFIPETYAQGEFNFYLIFV